MNTSPYFAELYASYCTEIADNMTDCEGRNVMQERLAGLRHEFAAYVPMMKIDPLIVAVLFYKAFEFRSNEAVLAALRLDPGKVELTWARVENSVGVASWATEMVRMALADPHGGTFLAIAACLEYLRANDVGDVLPRGKEEPRESEDEMDEEGSPDGDLGERGDDWLIQQGIDSTKQ